nr:receptor kinase-like protein Xa21 [Coffea arabica]
MLFISQNNFSGSVSPQIFGSYKSPTILDLSHNSLSGSLPLEVGKLANIQQLVVSSNKFSGEVPSTLGDCSSMQYLDMQSNLFNGTLPPALASLKGIQFLDLSHNNFSGQIPRDINSIDTKGNEFKALVYEYMQNGSLDMWLHSELAEATRSRNLDLLQTINIAVNVASALDYLHNHYEVAIVHCDLKPSNILLDNDLIAHVGDFGLAKLLPRTADIDSE